MDSHQDDETRLVMFGSRYGVVHIPGKENIEADKESRLSRRETEWTVQTALFKAATDKLGATPHIDGFCLKA